MSITDKIAEGIKDFFIKDLPVRIQNINNQITDTITLKNFAEIAIKTFNPVNALQGYPIINIAVAGGQGNKKEGTRKVIIGFSIKDNDPTRLEKLQYRYVDLICDSILESNRFNRLVESIVGDVVFVLYGEDPTNKTFNAGTIQFNITYYKSK